MDGSVKEGWQQIRLESTLSLANAKTCRDEVVT